MSLTGFLTRKIAFPGLEVVLGRRNLVRLSRLLTMESRLDSANDMAENGERMIQDVLLRYVPRDREIIVFDAGANVGEWTCSLLRRSATTNIRIHAFEPASATYAMLKSNLSPDQEKTVLVNQALSNEVGKAKFFIVGAGLGINSLHAVPKQLECTEEVELNTVDAYCRSSGINFIDLLKIDAEGHDLAVLEGARSMLQSRAISLVQFEYNQRWIESRHFLKDAFELLQPFGYKLGKITRRGVEFYPEWHFELESFREGNYLASLDDWPARFPQVKWWNLE